MAEKILALAADFEKLEADADARKVQLQPLVDAERQRQEEAVAAAQQEHEEQQRRYLSGQLVMQLTTGLLHYAPLACTPMGAARRYHRRRALNDTSPGVSLTPLQGCRGCGGKGAGGGAEAPGGGCCSAGGSSPERGQVWGCGLMGKA